MPKSKSRSAPLPEVMHFEGIGPCYFILYDGRRKPFVGEFYLHNTPTVTRAYKAREGINTVHRIVQPLHHAIEWSGFIKGNAITQEELGKEPPPADTLLSD